jgi:hypothetical protein
MFPRIGGGQKITHVMERVGIPTWIGAANKNNPTAFALAKKAAHGGGSTLLGCAYDSTLNRESHPANLLLMLNL